MATLNNRIALLEQKTCRNLDVRDMTDGELLDFFLAHPCSYGSHEEFILKENQDGTGR